MITQDDQDESLNPGAGPRRGDDAELPVPSEISPEEGQDILAKKDEEIKQLQDRILRMAAEMENTRKRLERDKSESISFANEGLDPGTPSGHRQFGTRPPAWRRRSELPAACSKA